MKKKIWTLNRALLTNKIANKDEVIRMYREARKTLNRYETIMSICRSKLVTPEDVSMVLRERNLFA